jgi:hypothetical protein
MAFAGMSRELGANPPANWQAAAELLRNTAGNLTGAQREGFEDAVALLLYRAICEGDVPLVDEWDPLRELKDPDYWRAM